MSLITIPTKGQRSEEVERVFTSLEKQAGSVPGPLKMFSVSPGLFQAQMRQIRYFSTHSTLNFELLTMVRYLSALELGFTPCIEFNATLLLKLGLTQEQLEDLAENPEKAPLEPAECKLLLFVLQGVRHGKTNPQDIAELHNLGWTDQDIVDCTAQGFTMISMGKMMQFLQV